jgi:dTDP-4-dehydrorhamnose reductase
MTEGKSLGKRILILGANGQLGVELQRTFAADGEITALGRDRCDLAEPEQVRRAITAAQPEIVLNAAAYTAVDRAESEPDLAMRVNGETPGVLAEETRRLSALLVHYSTDYVFDGSKMSPWVEDDPPAPLSVYGATKLAGERAIAQAGIDYLIFRTSWVISPHGHNFVRTMLKLGADREELKIVDDQVGAPTSALAIAQATRQVLVRIAGNAHRPAEYAGVYHMTCGGQTTWCDFARAIFATARPPARGWWARVKGIPTTDYPTPATRPKNSVLNNDKLTRAFGVNLASWDSALGETMKTLNGA